jgi:integrase/recombinase XerD
MDDKIYKYQRRLEVAQKSLREARMLQNNRRSIEDYVRFRRVNGLSTQRQCKYIYTLKLLGELADKRIFKDLTKEDMICFLDQIKSEPKDNGDPKYKLSTIRDFMILWRSFIAWVHSIEDPRHEGYPKAVSWFRPREPKNRLKPSDLITAREEENLLAACRNPRDRAIIAVESEVGLRPGELLGLKIQNVKVDSSYAELSVDGKTGVRPAYCIKSMPHLLAWLDIHPCRNDPEAYLWGLGGRALHTPRSDRC